MKITLISQALEGPLDPRHHWTTLRTTALDVTTVLPQFSPTTTRKLRLPVSDSHDIYVDVKEEKTG